MSWSTSELRVRLARRGKVKPSSKIIVLTVPRRCFFCESFMLFLSCRYCFPARLFIDALWSPAGKRLTSWLSFEMSNGEVVTFPLVSWVTCDAWLYRVLIFALFLALIKRKWRLFTKTTCVLHLVTLNRKYDITVTKLSQSHLSAGLVSLKVSFLYLQRVVPSAFSNFFRSLLSSLQKHIKH